jgi:DNA-binding PadR family transcriptional regulator
MHRHFHNHMHRGHGPFGGHMGGRFGHRGGGPRIGRLLEHGDLRFVVLALLSEQPRHGYELIKELEDRTGGTYRPSPGVIYPTLSLLEDEGFVTQANPDAGRKLYEITEAGKKALEANRPAVDAVFARIKEAGSASAMGSPRVQRALENLRTALRLRLGSGPLTEAQIDAIASALDAAAAQVERV